MICKKCHTDRPKERFRIRRKNGYSYVQGTCMDCEASAQRERYRKVKDIPEFKELNRGRVKRYRADNYDTVIEKDEIRRQTPRAKQVRKRYIKKNKAKIYEQEAICKSRYHQFHKENLTDIYVASKIIGKSSGICRNEIPIPLIKIKRLQLMGKRILKSNKEKIK